MKLRIGFIVLLVVLLAGCCTLGANGEEKGAGCFLLHILDWLFVPGPDGSAPFQILGMGLNILIPGSGALLTTAATAYAGFRKASQWKAAFHSTAQVIENGAELGMSAEDIKPHLEMAHVAAGVDHLTGPLVAKIKPDPAPTV